MATHADHTLRVDIVSDVVCPWCIIGYRQLLKAIELSTLNIELALHWHPFELNPQMPEQGQNLREHLAGKYGTTPEQSRDARARLTELGDSLGFRFDYFDEMRMVNTFRAHQLLHWAGTLGQQTELKLALFNGFFSERKDVSRVEVLVSTAADIGLDPEMARAVLDDGRYASAVRAEQKLWLSRNVHAVPTFIFNERFLVPGAQDAETLVKVLAKVTEPTAA